MTTSTATQVPTFGELVQVFAKVGLTSFGGPAGQIAMMHKILVDDKKWLDEQTYLLALNFCTLLPGPEAMQLATYSGWRLHGVKGGLAAGLLFVLPGAALILALAIVYAAYGSVPLVSALFAGIKAAVLAIVIEALFKISKRALKDRAAYVIAGLSFAAIFLLRLPFPLIVLAAGMYGYLRATDADGADTIARVAPVRLTQTLTTLALWLAIWILPLAAVFAVFGTDHVLSKLALFFSTLAIVTFGGAYAVLAYMAQEAVQTHGWLTAADMLNGLGLAETTPGPLILVTEFVGYLAAYRSTDAGSQLAMGMLGALVTLWATFAPCFLYIFAGAPYIERLKNAPRLRSALAAITAAVVGVILNLSVWFALHVLFRRVNDVQWGVMQLTVPDIASIDWSAAGIALIAAILLFRFHAGIMTTLFVAAALGLAAIFVSV